MKYIIKRTTVRPELEGQWDGPVWRTANTLDIANFRPESSDHRPNTQARLLYDTDGVYGIYRVEDRYVRCVHTNFQDQVCRDSCVEFFVRPAGAPVYLNFEFSCGGAFLCYCVTDPTRVAEGLKEYRAVSGDDGRLVRIYHSMPRVVEPEIEGEATWFLEFAIPFEMLAKYAGPVGDVAGRTWRANLYKCGDETSHPHWASWAPVDEKNFHLPRCFGEIVFEG